MCRFRGRFLLQFNMVFLFFSFMGMLFKWFLAWKFGMHRKPLNKIKSYVTVFQSLQCQFIDSYHNFFRKCTSSSQSCGKILRKEYMLRISQFFQLEVDLNWKKVKNSSLSLTHKNTFLHWISNRYLKFGTNGSKIRTIPSIQWSLNWEMKICSYFSILFFSVGRLTFDKIVEYQYFILNYIIRRGFLNHLKYISTVSCWTFFLFHVIDQIIIIPSWYDFRNFSIIRILFLSLVKCLPIPKEFDLVLFPTPETFWNKKHWWRYNIMTEWNIFQPRQLTLNCMFSNNTIMIFISWVLYKSR